MVKPSRRVNKVFLVGAGVSRGAVLPDGAMLAIHLNWNHSTMVAALNPFSVMPAIRNSSEIS